MKKNTFFMAIAMTLFIVSGSVTVWAQSATTENIDINAHVVSPILVDAIQDLNFGIVENTSTLTKTIAPTGVVSSSAGTPSEIGTQAGIGKITRSGDAAVNYRLTNVPTNLEHDVAVENHLLPVSAFTTAYTFTGAPILEDFTSGNATVSEDTLVEGTGDEIFVFIGATVAPAANMVSGNYSGEVTLSAEYN